MAKKNNKNQKSASTDMSANETVDMNTNTGNIEKITADNIATEEKENATMTNEIIINNTNINADNTINANNTAADKDTAISSSAAGTAIQVAGLSREQLMAILQNAGIDTSTVNITAKQPKINGRLTYVDEEKTQAICSANSEHVFNINELDEEARIESMKSGLCPHCLSIMKQAAEIKAASGFRTRTVTNNQPSVEKPGFKIRQIIKDNMDNIDAELLNKLQDKTFSRENFKLAYPMFLNITGMSAEEIKVARKDAKNHDRYSPMIYTINGQQLLLTNDLYGKNLEPIANFFAKLVG